MRKFSLLLFCFFAIVLPIKAQSDGQVFYDAAMTLLSGNSRAQDCDFLRQVAEQQQLPQLAAYADVLQQRLFDRGNQQQREAAKALFDKACSSLAQPSEATILCRRAYIDAMTNAQYDESLRMTEQNEQDAQRLAEAHPDDLRYRDLYLVTRLDRIQNQWSIQFYDSPSQWENLFLLESEVVDRALEIQGPEPAYRLWILQNMGLMKTTTGQYMEYVNRLACFFTSEDAHTPAVTYPDGQVTNAGAYLQQCRDECEKLFGVDDKRTMMADYFYLQFSLYKQQMTPDEVYEQLNILLRRLSGNEPAEAPLSLQVRMLMWECDIYTGQRLEETAQYAEVLRVAEDSFGRYSADYVFTLFSIISQRQLVNVDEANALAAQLEEVSDRLYRDKPVEQGFVKMFLMTLKQATLSPDDYHKYIEDICALYAHSHASEWQSIGLGHALANELRTMGAYPMAAEVFSLAFNDERTLLHPASMGYAFELIAFSRYLTNSQYAQQAEQALNDAYAIFTDDDMKALTLYYLHQVQLQQGKAEQAKVSLRKAIDNSTSEDMVILKCYMQMVLGNMLIYEAGAMTEEAERLFLQAEPVFWKYENEVRDDALDGYVKLSNYYQTRKDFAKAEEILTKGKERLEVVYGVYDDLYLSFIRELFGIYAFEYNDLDRADRFIQQSIAGAEDNPLFSRHDLLVEMYWMKYQLVKTRSPNNYVMQMNSLQETFAKLSVMQQQVGGELAPEMRDQMMPFIYEMVRLCPFTMPDEEEWRGTIEEARRVSPKAAERLVQQHAQIKQMYVELLLPLLIEHEERVRVRSSGTGDYDDYMQVVNAISRTHLVVEKDTVQALSWLDRLKDVDNPVCRYRYAYDKADLLYSCRRYAEAAQLYEQVEGMAQDLQAAMNSAMYKAQFYNRLFGAYYYSGQYDKAISPAREFRRYQKDYMEKNFNLLTQEERGQMADQGAAGGDCLQTLVPRFEQELAGETYNSLLDEKGMLLRAADRSRQAILLSGDRQLIAELDSLERLRTAYQQMEQMNNWQQGDFNANPAFLAMHNQIERLEREVNRGAAPYLVDEKAVPSWQQVQACLNKGDAAIEFLVSDTIMGALVLLPDGQQPHYVALTGAPSMARELYEQGQKGGAHAQADALYGRDVLHLYQRLWQPMESLLQGVRCVYFSPIGFIHSLAFAAFRCPDGQYLVDHYELHQLTTTAQLVNMGQESAPKRMQAALCGAVFYSEGQHALAQQIEGGGTERGLDDGRGAKTNPSETFGFLSFTENEVQQIEQAAVQSGRVEAQRVEGFEPTEQWLRSLSGHSPDILHLSTHGFFLATDKEVMDNKFLSRFPALRFSPMMRSGLALVGANNAWEGVSLPDDADGIVTASEVAAIDLSHTCLAVLSACQTGVGFSNKEGVYGMYRGFKQAGVKSIMASLWNVNDKTTAILMAEFYRRWLAGTPMQDALCEAQKELRKNYPSPFYWAPFFLLDAR